MVTTLHSSKIAILKEFQQKTPVVFRLRSYWLQYPGKNLVLFQVSFCLSVGLPAEEFPLESFLALFGSWKPPDHPPPPQEAGGCESGAEISLA